MSSDRVNLALECVVKIAGPQQVGRSSVKRAIENVAEATNFSPRRIRSILHREIKDVSDAELAILQRCAAQCQTKPGVVDDAGAVRAEIDHASEEILANLLLVERHLARFMARMDRKQGHPSEPDISRARKILDRVIDVLLPATETTDANGLA